MIMIIIKIIIQYFIQIRYTDDFPSTGTRLVWCNEDNSEQNGRDHTSEAKDEKQDSLVVVWRHGDCDK